MGRQQDSKYFKQEQDETDAAMNLSAPSFGSKLNLSAFKYSPNPTPHPTTQPSPRNPPSNTSTPRPSASPLKRKATTNPRTCANESPPRGKKPRSRAPTGYAPPTLYAHLPPLPDVLAPNLICVFVGLNPGLQTARDGHAYAHPSNLFWKLLYASGCTPRLLRAEDDVRLPAWYAMGNTNIVARPTRNGSELSKREMDDGVGILEEKIRVYRPESVALVGKGIWESVWRVRKGRAILKHQFRYGWQSEGENLGIVKGEDSWGGARVFVASSTSGLAASLLPAEKESIWRELGSWIEQRRRERDSIHRVKEEVEDNG
ncbi:uracil DNA N-glycosylase Thp1 [Ciborinia camelliae]|nr:uracil DNA N-glycosylase Thp1 [Ciborinia camelliae]